VKPRAKPLDIATMLGTSIAAGFPQRVPGQDKAKYVLCKLLAKIIF